MSMSEIFSVFVLGIREKSLLERKFSKKVFRYDDNNLCHLWAGSVSRDGYGYLQIMIRGKSRKLAAHRLSFFIGHGFTRLDPSLHVSHLCHNKLCVNLDHLSLEPASVNLARRTCVKENKCLGHTNHESCRL